MLAILHPDVDEDSLEYRQTWEYLEQLPGVELSVNTIQGKTRKPTEIYLLGNTAAVDLDQVAALETMLESALHPLESVDAVNAVRVTGAVGAVEMRDAFNVEQSRQRFIDRGVFIRPLGRVIYLTPSYTMDTEDLGALTDAIAEEVAFLSQNA